MDEPRFRTKLKLWKYEVERHAKRLGLEHLPIKYNLVDFEEMSEVVARHGFPTMPQHWQYGQASIYWKKHRKFGLGIVYELVVNTDPVYAYLLDCNSLTTMKSVMAHVIGHAHLFGHNAFCRSQSRKMLSVFGNDALWFEEQCAIHGEERVKRFYDSILSLEPLIDIHSPFLKREAARKTGEERAKELEKFREVKRIAAADDLPAYMEEFLNPLEWIEAERKRLAEKEEEQRQLDKGLVIPEKPTRDVLKFLMLHAPLEDWQRGVIAMIWRSAYYVLTGARVKGIHEGWASFWEEQIMHGSSRMLHDAEFTEFNEQMAGVQRKRGLNPYRLFYDLICDVKFRWDTGRHGRIWDECEDADIKNRWDEFIVYKALRSQSRDVGDLLRRWTEFSAFVSELKAGNLGYPKELFMQNFLLRQTLIPTWVRYLRAHEELKGLKRRLRETEEIERELPADEVAAAANESPVTPDDEVTAREQLFKIRRDLFFSKDREDLWVTTGDELRSEIRAVETLVDFGRRYRDGLITTETVAIPSVWEQHAAFYSEPVELGKGLEKLFEVMATYDDVTFLEEFFTKEFCEKQKYFLYKAKQVWSEVTWSVEDRYVIETRSFDRIKKRLLFQYTNLYTPIIVVENANYLGEDCLCLKHTHVGVDLDSTSKDEMFMKDVLKNIFEIWGGKRTVYLETIVTEEEEEKPWWWFWHRTDEKTTPDEPQVLTGTRVVFTYGLDEDGGPDYDIEEIGDVEFPAPF